VLRETRSPGGPVEKEDAKTRRACGWICLRWQGERNVLIVSVLLHLAIDLTLRSNTQRRIEVLRVCQAPILQGVAATPITVMGDAEVADQALAASLVP
jgi:hypothetical protein